MNILHQGVDNLFNANHRFHMLDKHKGTMAQIYTVEQLTANYLTDFEHDCKIMTKGYCNGCTELDELARSLGTATEYGKQFAV